MNLPKDMKTRFERFMIDVFGVEWIAGKRPKGEAMRCMFRERLIILREHDMRRSSDSLEVFCSNKDLVKELEAEFYLWVAEVEGIELTEEERK